MRIGIDLGGSKIEGIVLNDDGTLAKKLRIDTPAGSYGDTLSTVCELINQLQNSSSSPLSVGIGTPGALSLPSKLMKNCNSTCLNGKPLQADIAKILGYEVRLENDANCFALSEAQLGAGKNSKIVFGIIIGTGTGGGIVIDKKLLNGPNSITGEWGHNSIPDSVRELIKDDRVCYCGRRNCIETVLSGGGLAKSFLESGGEPLEAIEIAELAEQGDTLAKECIDLYCQQLAHCLATVVNIVDPDLVVFGGGLSNITALYQKVPLYLEGQVFTDVLQTRLAAPSFGDASGARGAACLWPTAS